MMKTTIAVCAGLIFGLAHSAEPLPAKLPPHPRLLFTAGDLPNMKARIEREAWAKSHFNRRKANADDWLKKAVELLRNWSPKSLAQSPVAPKK